MASSPRSQAPNQEAAETDETAEQHVEGPYRNKENNGDQIDDAIDSHEVDDYADINDINFDVPSQLPDDPGILRDRELIATSTPATELEVALRAELDRQIQRNDLLAGECAKLRGFIAKRKQTYKRKRKDESAPRKKLSGYNLFVRERFAKLAKENEEALKSSVCAELKRIPPASNIASSGHAWSLLNAEEKARYNEMAKPDEDRFQKETANYQAPEKLNRKRNRTGYNVFFSQHVLELKQNDGGVPPERGSVARIVGDAWKKMSAEEKDVYERQADEQNEIDPVDMPPPPPPQPLNTPVAAPPPGTEQHLCPPVVEPNAGDSGPVPADGMPPPSVQGMPPYPPEYIMHGPPPPVIHQPPGYESYYGVPPPPYDPYAYPPPLYPGMPPGMPPPGTETMPPYGPPPNYQGPFQSF